MNDAKDVEFYSQGVAAWFNSALEHDKSLLTLSVAGVGFLVSIMQMENAIDCVCTLILFIGAILSFVVCLASVLWIFKRNKKHIMDVFNGKKDSDSVLGILDNIASYSFMIAMLLSALLGISMSITTYISKGNTLATDNSKNSAPSLPFGDSFNGFAKLNPQVQTPMQNKQTTQTAATAPTPVASTQSNSASTPKK